MRKSLNLLELLNFYDRKVPTSNGHASAINAVIGEDLGVALLTHFFKSQTLNVDVLDTVCTQGTQSGHRLDKWIAVKSNSEAILYQVEIKNWSAHSISGMTVKTPFDETYMAAFRKQRWQIQFDHENRVPSQKQTLKVLTKMRAPLDYSKFSQKPLLCFWEPLHPEGRLEAFFNVDVSCDSFKQLSVFSMSNYVSILLQSMDSLEVDLPDANARLEWLKRIYH